MELFDLYDKHGNKLNKTMDRGGSNQPGEYHLVVHVWIRHSNASFLIQQRNKQSDHVPHQWGCTSGAVMMGETSVMGAIREVKEEIGLVLKQTELRRIKRYVIDHEQANYITDVYVVDKDIDLKTLTLDPTEVKQVSYQSLPEIKKMIQKNQFWDYERLLERKGYFTLLEKS